MTIIFGEAFRNLGKELELSYLNPNELQDMSSRLHVCETLFGDFNARVLVLLQDAADVETLHKLSRLNPEKPILAHSEKAITNIRLVSWLKDFFPVTIDGLNAKNCGLYYANAVWLLKRNGGMSGPISKRTKVLDICSPVLSATLQNLKKLELVLAFGRQSFTAINRLSPLKRTWEEALSSSEAEDFAHQGRKLKVFALNHPAARIYHAIQEQRLRGLLKTYFS